MPTALEPAQNVTCPTCGATPGKPCTSRRAIRIHQARYRALADLEKQATRILRGMR